MKFEPELVRDILLDIEKLHHYPEPFSKVFGND